MTPRSPSVQTQVARSLGLPRVLLPYAGRLFAGVEAMTPLAGVAVRWLASEGIGEGDRVLDLGCGRGGVSVAIARRLGCKVIGVDGCEEFIRAARELAARIGVADRCRFIVGDYRAHARGRFDAALMLDVAPAPDAAGILRRCVRRGGVFIVDDAVAIGREAEPTLMEWAIRREIESLKCVVLRERIARPAEVRRAAARVERAVSMAAAVLAREHPELRTSLRDFLASHRQAARRLVREWRPAMWLVRRSD